MFPRSDGLSPIWAEWHQKRQEARETAFSINEFGQSEITKYDLDTAGITGEDNDLTYQFDPTIDLLGTAKVDVRNLSDR